MDAAPVLVRVAEVLQKYGLEAVLIGNAAAAPVVADRVGKGKPESGIFA